MEIVFLKIVSRIGIIVFLNTLLNIIVILSRKVYKKKGMNQRQNYKNERKENLHLSS